MSKKTVVNVIIILAVVAAVAGVIAVKQRPAEQTPPSAEAPPTPAQPPEETTVNAPEKIPTLVDLGADKCIPCKKMAPILDALKEEYAGRMKVVFHDVWKDPEPAKEYGIRLIPTQIFLAPDGTELARHEGFISKEDILAKWNELGIVLGSGADESSE